MEIIKSCFDCLFNLANKMVNKVNDEETNNDNKIKQLKKYETIESDIVKINVGGTMFSTLKTTLTKKIKDKDGKLYLPNMFESLVDGFVKPKYDENKAIFIDRNPKYFGCILDYLRMANTDFEYEVASSIDKNELLKEAIFYNIQGLVDLIELSNRATRDGFSAQIFHSRCDYDEMEAQKQLYLEKEIQEQVQEENHLNEENVNTVQMNRGRKRGRPLGSKIKPNISLNEQMQSKRSRQNNFL